MLLIGLVLVVSPAFAQQKRVGSDSYNLLLKTLLSHSVPEVSVVELRQQGPVLLLEAREKREYDGSHLKDAVFVGYNELNLSLLNQTDKNRPIVVYCSVGYRREKVAKKLQTQGFKNVQNLYGGIFKWTNEGTAVFNKEGKTCAVHAYNRTWGMWLKTAEKVYDRP